MKHSFILLNIESDNDKQVTGYLNTIKIVKKVTSVFGSYDLIVELIGENTKEIRECVNWKIRKIHHVRSTLTLMVYVPGEKNE